MDKPHIVEAVSADRALQRGLRLNAPEPAAARQPEGRGGIWWPPWLQRIGPANLGAAVAVLVAAVSLASLFQRSATLEELQGRLAALDEPVANPATLTLRSFRAAADEVVYRVPADARLIVVEVELDSVAHDEYRVRLRRVDGEEPFTAIDGLRPTAIDTLQFMLPAARLTPGRYELTVDAAQAAVGGEVMRLPLTVRAAAAD